MSRVAALVAARSTKAAGVPSISEDGTFITAPLSWLPWLAPTATTGPLTADGSLALPTIYACVRVLSEDVASLPLILYRRLAGGGKERATDHPLYDVLHDAPNPEMTSFTWRETLMTHLLTWGNAPCELIYDTFGRLQIWPLPPSRIEIKWEDDAKAFYYLGSSERKRLKDGTVFHVMGQSLNGLVGLSPIALHRETLGEQTATRDFGRAFYRNMARPATILKHPKSLSTAAADRLKTQIEGLKGSRNAGKTVLLEEGLDYAEIGIPPEDAQYVETRKLQREEAAQLFRMPPHKVGILDHATFSNIEHSAIDYVTGTLRPWLVRIEQAIKTQLLPNEPDIFAEFLVDGLLRGDAQARSQALATQWQHGALSSDEWREIENRNPLEGGAGTQTYVPVNYAPAEPAITEEPVEEETFPPLVALKGWGEFHCPDCGKLVNKRALPGVVGFCRSCKAEKTMPGELPEPEPAPDPFADLPERIAAALPIQKAPEVHFHEGAFKSGDIHVEPTRIERGAVEVHVAAPDLPTSPDVSVSVPAPRPIRRLIERDERDKIISITEVPA